MKYSCIKPHDLDPAFQCGSEAANASPSVRRQLEHVLDILLQVRAFISAQAHILLNPEVAGAYFLHIPAGKSIYFSSKHQAQTLLNPEVAGAYS